MRAAAAIVRQATSAIPAEGDLVENARAEFFRRTGHGLAAKRAIKLDGGVVFRQRPDDQRFQPALRQVAARGREQAAAEAEPLEFRPQIKLVDLAVIMQAARAVCVRNWRSPRDLLAELQQRDAAAFCELRCPTKQRRGD